jgi:hypothetical protein
MTIKVPQGKRLHTCSLKLLMQNNIFRSILFMDLKAEFEVSDSQLNDHELFTSALVSEAKLIW